MKTYNYLIVSLLTLFLISCSTTNSESESNEVVEAKAKLVEADATFSIEMFKKAVALEKEAENVFISPLSISVALGMAMNGANGSTHEEMVEVLGFGELNQNEINIGYESLIKDLNTADEKVQMEIANSIWSKQGFPVKEDFYSTLEDYFDAEAQELDFDDPASVDVINGWVSDKTHEKIPTIIERIGSDVVMYLINAVYFKASWLYSFDAEQTQQQNFYKDDGSSVLVEMMNQKNNVPYYISDEVEVLELPYGDGQFSMTFVKHVGDVPIDEFIETTLTTQNLEKWLGALETDSVKFFLPKLEMEYFSSLKDHLVQMGMPTAFSSNADFSNITPGGGILISDVLHKTYVKMDEEGTEAAGVTAIGFETTSVDPDPEPIIILNRSYVMILREKETGALLFMGKIGQPVFEITD